MIALILAQLPPGQSYNPGMHASKPNVVSGFNDNDPNSAPCPTKKELRSYAVEDLRRVASRLLSMGNHDSTKKSKLVKLLHRAMEDRTISSQALERALKAPVPLKSPPTMSRRLTLIVCPVSVMSNWQDQIDTHVAPRTLRVACFLGPQRHELLAQENQWDILITSYHTLQADYRPIQAQQKAAVSGVVPSKKSKQSTIFDLPFFRGKLFFFPNTNLVMVNIN